MPRLQVWSPVGVCMRRQPIDVSHINVDLSLSLSLSIYLSQQWKNVLRWGKKILWENRLVAFKGTSEIIWIKHIIYGLQTLANCPRSRSPQQWVAKRNFHSSPPERCTKHKFNIHHSNNLKSKVEKVCRDFSKTLSWAAQVRVVKVTSPSHGPFLSTTKRT